jgi:hypothetical protein
LLARREGSRIIQWQDGEVDRVTAQLSRAAAAAFPQWEHWRRRRWRPSPRLLFVRSDSPFGMERYARFPTGAVVEDGSRRSEGLLWPCASRDVAGGCPDVFVKGSCGECDLWLGGGLAGPGRSP